MAEKKIKRKQICPYCKEELSEWEDAPTDGKVDQNPNRRMKMKKVKFLQQIGSETKEQFAERIEDFLNNGWEVAGFACDPNVMFNLTVMLVKY